MIAARGGDRLRRDTRRNDAREQLPVGAPGVAAAVAAFANRVEIWNGKAFDQHTATVQAFEEVVAFGVNVRCGAARQPRPNCRCTIAPL